MKLLDDESHIGAYTMIQYDLSHYMKLDTSAVKALNLTPGPLDGTFLHSPREQEHESLRPSQQMQNSTRYPTSNSFLGSRMLGQWIKQPLMDIDEIGSERINIS